MKTERQLERRLDKTRMSPIAWVLVIIFTGGLGLVVWLFMATINYFEAKGIENKLDAMDHRTLSNYEKAKLRQAA